jgi:hypothetical protein
MNPVESNASLTRPARATVVLGFAALLLSCASGEPKAGLGPNEPPAGTRLAVSPASATVATDGTLTFSAQLLAPDGSSSVPSVLWTATGGTISADGVYTPSSTTGSFTVTASLTDYTLSDSAAVTVVAPPSPIVSISISPGSASLYTGGTQQFTATATRQDGSTLSPGVNWSATGGTITTAGRYTAGGTAGTFKVIAVEQGGTLADTSVVTLAAPVLQAVVLSPANAAVVLGGTLQFTVSGQWSNGATTAPPVTYSATGGAISSGGLYSAGGTEGTFRVIAVLQGGTLADTSTVTLTQAPPPSMYFNSSEVGCGTDSNVLLCDDFESGAWYTKNCDQANASGGLLQTDGWCGTIYNDAGMAAGTARCGGAGFHSSCAATTGAFSGAGNMADHELANGQGVAEIWVRFYTKPLAGYTFGAEKMLTFNDGAAGDGGIKWGNLSWNCADNSASTGTLTMGFPLPMDVCQKQNMGNNITIQAGNWYFYEVHYRLSTPGQADGVFELWVDNCGPNGTTCPATPTLRMRRTDVNNGRASTSELIRVLWFEAWSNPASQGERYWDQIKVAKVGPIGFMP